MKKRDSIAIKKYRLGPIKMVMTVNMIGEIGIWCRSNEQKYGMFVRNNAGSIRSLSISLFQSWIDQVEKKMGEISAKFAEKFGEDFDHDEYEQEVVDSLNAWC